MEKITEQINEYQIIKFIKDKYPKHFLCDIKKKMVK